jgi:hypothetical protein
VRKKISAFILPLVFFTMIYGAYQCIDKIIVTNKYKKVVSTPCLKSKDGNCYCWDYVYGDGGEERRENCQRSCDLEACNAWNSDKKVVHPQNCLTEERCRCYSGPELGASCEKYECPKYLDEVTTERVWCNSSYCH